MESRDAVAERTQQLAEAALEEGAMQGNIALLRSSAEMFALSACISSDNKAIALLRSLCAATASSSAPLRSAPMFPETTRKLLHEATHLQKI